MTPGSGEGKAVTTWDVGDAIVGEARHVGDVARVGEILKVLGDAARPHFAVRWDDGHETIYYPSSDASVHHPQRSP
jgi:rRNA processing protein Gar1